jgi:hypothetical protein
MTTQTQRSWRYTRKPRARKKRSKEEASQIRLVSDQGASSVTQVSSQPRMSFVLRTFISGVPFLRASSTASL